METETLRFNGQNGCADLTTVYLGLDDIRDTREVMHEEINQVELLKDLLHVLGPLKMKVVKSKNRRADRVSRH